MSRSGRITLQEAVRLGFVKPEAAKPSGAKGRTKPASAVVKSAADAKPARTSKAPRLPNAPANVPFDVRFVVPGEPRTKGRARTFMPRGQVRVAFQRAGGDAVAFEAGLQALKHRSFTPKATVEFERVVAQVAAGAMRSTPPYHLPVEVVVAFVFEGDPTSWPTAHDDPDIDNAKKAVLDALKGIVWTDDRLVVRASSVKVCGPAPGVLVRVRSAEPYDFTALVSGGA